MYHAPFQFNVFIVPMTITPFEVDAIAARPGPRYRAIADHLRHAIRSGAITPGTRLPPLRDLAFSLGVTVGTVSRAYALSASRGEIAGEVGRGTYVLDANTPAMIERGGVGSSSFTTLPDSTEIAMKSALAAPVGQSEIIGAAMRTYLDAQPAEPSPFNTYLMPGGAAHHRQAAAGWLGYKDFRPTADEIIICSGAQQAILTAILAATRPGDIILTEALTYSAILQQTELMGRRIAPVAIDEEGLVPEALERALAEHKPAAIFTVPTLQNPTTAIMGAHRRAEIAALARAHEVAIIEDDIYGALVEDRPEPIAAHYPEGSYYTTSLAKSVGAGLRIGFLLPPRAMLERARAIQHGFGQTVPLFMADMATCLIKSGDAHILATRQREEMRARHMLAREALKGHAFEMANASLYAWLALPESWRPHAFVEAARHRGLALAAGEDFMVGRPDKAARNVRLALGQPQTREELTRGLGIIAELLENGPMSSSLMA
ncbi:MAG: aminotransferase class I/II-fold pyridoxal phosphate-dependent enzyme [Rhizobiales bacterium]|nr:aminotransferase class I/II-fold pyridoxal phosphate-dependent enzyme [Hyphomicrobiales bacterium]